MVRWPCPPAGAPPIVGSGTPGPYLAIRYVECSSRPVRAHVAACSCDESACEYSRVRDSFELGLLTALPDSHTQMQTFYTTWRGIWKTWKAQATKQANIFPLPIPECPVCPEDPWVVLATLTLPTTDKPRIVENMIGFEDRLPLYSFAALQISLTCK